MAVYFKVKTDAIDPITQFPVARRELLTPKERFTLAKYLDDSSFEIVEISRKKTFKSFGARFEIEDK